MQFWFGYIERLQVGVSVGAVTVLLNVCVRVVASVFVTVSGVSDVVLVVDVDSVVGVGEEDEIDVCVDVVELCVDDAGDGADAPALQLSTQ